jgi:hypothetical protein
MQESLWNLEFEDFAVHPQKVTDVISCFLFFSSQTHFFTVYDIEYRQEVGLLDDNKTLIYTRLSV